MPRDNDMMLVIEETGEDYGSCVVCHGGNPTATITEEAHRGAPEGVEAEAFYPDPHAAAPRVRSCPSCHVNPKALGYGIEDRTFEKNDATIVVDLKGPDGQVIPKTDPYRGSHRTLSGPLPQEMRDKMERSGVCLGCHQLMGDEEFCSKLARTGYLTDREHLNLMKKPVEALAARLSKPWGLPVVTWESVVFRQMYVCNNWTGREGVMLFSPTTSGSP